MYFLCMFSIIPLSELSQFARTELSGKRRASKGTEFAKAAPARDPPQAEPAEAAAASGSNGADAEQAPTPPPTADVEAGPAEAGPGEGAQPRPAARVAGGRRSG